MARAIAQIKRVLSPLPTTPQTTLQKIKPFVSKLSLKPQLIPDQIWLKKSLWFPSSNSENFQEKQTV